MTQAKKSKKIVKFFGLPKNMYQAIRFLARQYESNLKFETKIEDIRSILINLYESGYLPTKLLQEYRWGTNSFFSQGNEDSVLLEIINRLGMNKGSFLEIGIGDGTENNTLILKALGFSGTWVDVKSVGPQIKDNGSFQFLNARVQKHTCTEILSSHIKKFGIQPNIFSLDIDGNDYHIVSSFLEAGLSSEVIVCEYNPKFPPPIQFIFPYDPNHTWQGGDFYGASLTSLNELLVRHQYVLLACSLNGTNAFFVKEGIVNLFQDKQMGLSNFMPAQYIFPERKGHKATLELVGYLLDSTEM
jgi:hypothetical protein